MMKKVARQEKVALEFSVDTQSTIARDIKQAKAVRECSEESTITTNPVTKQVNPDRECLAESTTTTKKATRQVIAAEESLEDGIITRIECSVKSFYGKCTGGKQYGKQHHLVYYYHSLQCIIYGNRHLRMEPKETNVVLVWYQ